MTAPYCDLLSKLEQAAQLLGQSKQPGYTWLCGQSNADIAVPCVVCYAEPAQEEDPHNSGNFWVPLAIEVIYAGEIDANGVDPKPLNDLMVKSALDVFMSTTIAADLSGAGIADLTVMGVRARGVAFRVSGDQWINSLTLQALCCPVSFPN